MEEDYFFEITRYRVRTNTPPYRQKQRVQNGENGCIFNVAVLALDSKTEMNGVRFGLKLPKKEIFVSISETTVCGVHSKAFDL